MSRFTAVDLSGMAAPTVVEALDYETILEALKADAVARLQADGIDYDVQMIESDPAVKVLEVAAYRELLLRARVNSAARAVMLAYAQGTDLDHLGVYYGVQRMLVTAATNSNPAVYESDARLRQRIQLAPEAFSTAGPTGAYQFHAMTADVTVKSVQVYQPTPGEVHVLPLVSTGNGIPGSTVLSRIRLALSAENIRPLTDMLTVRAPGTVSYTIDMQLDVGEGPDLTLIETNATAAVNAYLASRHKVGTHIMRSGLIAAAHVAGVESVALNSPTQDVVPDEDEVALPSSITIEAVRLT